MKTLFRNLIADESGASLVEYALLLALISVAVIGAVTTLRTSIIGVFNATTSAMGGAAAPAA